MKKVGILSLGCARNLIDSEIFLGRLKTKDYEIVKIEDAQTAIINTCTFIKEAKEESIDRILDLIQLKKEGRLKKIIVCGCLVQRYKERLSKELPEVDAFVGVPTFNHSPCHYRLSPDYYAYVKICEGCLSNCSFCIIPKIKKFASRAIESILCEIKELDLKGCREINIIGQDITTYGRDLYQRFKLTELLKEITRITKNIKWVRLLYLSPERITDDLIKLIADSEKIVKYVDLPLQHVNNRILRLMGRATTKKQIYELIDKIRRTISNVVLRTSLIVGFPTETEEEFLELLNFIKEVRFERLGAFIYSQEEGTVAAQLEGQIPQRVKERRFNMIMSAQQEVARKLNQRFLGRDLDVLIEEKKEPHLFLGRSQYDAPEVDGLVWVKSREDLEVGSFQKTRIIDAWEYDLVGEICGEDL
ncbi:MAG: MiaB/RimO family radical SAM methylthiotransferase [Candidatus Omnitrophica bacterium]|nr:MiaB/RimO family radical SAM methylthiotransferase [Candidatus Omnitrophota bacterium]